MRAELADARAFLFGELELHVGSELLITVQQFLAWCTSYVMNLLDLIEFVVPREEREEREDLEKNASNAPVVHFVIVIAVGEKAFGWPIPTC